MKNQKINERFDVSFAESRSSADSNVIENIAIVGKTSKNGYDFPESTLRQAFPLVDDVPSFLDHEGMMSSMGRIKSLIGKFQNARFENGRIYADLHLFDNEHTPLVKQIASTTFRPGTIGMSINANGEFGEHDKKKGEKPFVSVINEFLSVDLVATPAATETLFNSQTKERGDNMDWKDVTLDVLKYERKDLLDAYCAESMRPALERVKELETEVASLKNAAEVSRIDALVASLNLSSEVTNDSAVMAVIRDTLAKENGQETVKKLFCGTVKPTPAFPPQKEVKGETKFTGSVSEFIDKFGRN